MSKTKKRRGFMLILSSPSGGGKTTISRMLLDHDDNLTLSVSATTRQKREGEIEGVHYYFMPEEKFMKKAKNDEFFEHENVHGNHYGTPKKIVEKSLNAGVDVLFDIDWQGTRQLTQKARQDIVSVFILPPSMKELHRRLTKRGQDSEEIIAHRMSRAKEEISHWQEYDYVIVNRTLEESMHKVNHILRAERLRRERQHDLPNFVDELLEDDS